MYKQFKTNIDPIIVHTFDMWFKVRKRPKIQNDVKMLKWVTYYS